MNPCVRKETFSKYSFRFSTILFNLEKIEALIIQLSEYLFSFSTTSIRHTKEGRIKKTRTRGIHVFEGLII